MISQDITGIERRTDKVSTLFSSKIAIIEAMAERLSSPSGWPEFHQAVDLMKATRGRVVMCGMGKSGHIARKIAATLSSLGTPSQYVHPAEASHGDLGMITTDDVVICLSNSGNTAELAAVINYANCRQIPLIGITMNPESFLGRSSNVVLCLPKSAEGCAIGLAPTTSTTAQVALGDALAVAITVDRQFAKSDFNHFHPGGSLGKTTSRVAEIMKSTEACVCVGISTRADEIALLMAQKRVDIAAVVDAQGELIGMLYAKDLSMPNLMKTAGDLMSHEVFAAVSVHASMSDADIIMDAMNVNTLFVLDSEASLAGMVHREA